MIFEEKKLGTRQVVPNSLGTPNPKIFVKMLLINLVQGHRDFFYFFACPFIHREQFVQLNQLKRLCEVTIDVAVRV